MCEEELVTLFSEDKDVYCISQNFAFGSEEAKQAHENIKEIQQDGCQIINVENMTEEEMNIFLERINARIQKYEEMNALCVNMLIRQKDLDGFFGADGTCLIENLKCATPEIKELINNPKKISELKTIREFPYIRESDDVTTIIDMTPDKRVSNYAGYAIPMFAYGDLFTLEEVEKILGFNGLEKIINGLSCQLILAVYKENSQYKAIATKANKLRASVEDKKKFEIEKKVLFDKYKANYKLIRSYKNIKEQVLKIYSKNSKKM